MAYANNWQFVFDLLLFKKPRKCSYLPSSYTPVASHLDRLLTSYSTKTDDGISFLGEGSLAGAPTPRVGGKGIHPVIKVIDDRCL